MAAACAGDVCRSDAFLLTGVDPATRRTDERRPLDPGAGVK
jgi:hypothetical protein